MSDKTNAGVATPNPTREEVAEDVSDGLAGAAATATSVRQGQALLVARFASMDQAKASYDALRDAEETGALRIDGVLVVKADAHGKVHIQKLTDHSTRTGLKWGAVAGVAIGLIFPPTILAGAIAYGVAGAGVGKLYSIGKKSAIADQLELVVTPGTSGIVALVAIDDVDAITSTIPQAVVVKAVPIDDDTARAVLEAASAKD